MWSVTQPLALIHRQPKSVPCLRVHWEHLTAVQQLGSIATSLGTRKKALFEDALTVQVDVK